jgi:hypothetical protein
VLESFQQVGAGGYRREGNVLKEDWQKPLDSPMLLLQILVEHLIGRPHQFACLLQSLNQHIARHDDKHRGTQLLIGNETILLICPVARGETGGERVVDNAVVPAVPWLVQRLAAPPVAIE